MKYTFYYKDGSIVESNSYNPKFYMLHREDGPAIEIEGNSNRNSYFLNGRALKFKEWLILTKPKEEDFVEYLLSDNSHCRESAEGWMMCLDILKKDNNESRELEKKLEGIRERLEID